MKKAVKVLHAELRAEGFLVEVKRGGHVKITHPDKRGIVFMGSTPSDPRALKNTLADLNRVFSFRPARSSAR